MRTPILAATAAVLLSACAADGGAGAGAGAGMSAGPNASNEGMPLRTFFQCEGGKALVAQYFGRDRVVVTTSGQSRFELPRATGEAGNVYADGGVRFGTDLTTATLTGTPLDPFTGCRAQS